MYVSQFTGGIPTIKVFTYVYRGLMTIVADMGLVQILGAHEILKILNSELDLSLQLQDSITENT